MLRDIRVVNFRVFRDSNFSFGEGVNIIVGPNGCGKTSVLEAIMVGSQGGSFRVKDEELINKESEWLKIEISFDDIKRTIKINKGSLSPKIIEQNNKKYKRMVTDLKIPLVLFEPNNINLLSSSPETRRNYLDNLAKVIYPGYSKLISDYNKNLLQRNNLLKKLYSNNTESLFPWNIRLTQLSEQIVTHRVNLIKEINKHINSVYKKISNKDDNIAIEYYSKLNTNNYANSHLNALESGLEEDLRAGFTRHGSHRDDFVLKFNNNTANGYTSRGEARSAILSLKVAEVHLQEKMLKKSPLLLLDDVFSELDSNRRHALTKLLGGYQSFITTTDADIISNDFKGHCEVIVLEQ